MSVYVGSARIDENGKAYGGKSGDQTGKEVSRQKFYVHPKGWRVFRPIERAVGLTIAETMDAACDNNKIGYDQWNRHTLFTQAKKVDYDVSKVTAKCETDCSALVRVCLAAAGIFGIPESFRTGNMPATLLKTGKFVEMKGSKYTGQATFLGKGDILVTKTSGHTVVVLDDGPKFEGAPVPKAYELGERILRNGDEGKDVKLMQVYLVQLGYKLSAYGANGDFDDATEIAVREFQKAEGLEVDGEYGPKSHAAMLEAIERETATTGAIVKIQNGNCWVRKAPNTTADKIGVAYNGEVYTYQGETASNGWHLIEYKGQNGWVSGRYGKLEE